MLRAVRLNNFVKFRKDCKFYFRQDGANFFVGQNGSGKSSVLEAIRRCLSQNSNTSFSRMPNESKPSYIICEYEIPDENRSLFDGCKTVFTSFLHIPDADSNYTYAKIVLLMEHEKVFIELIERKNTSHDMKHCTCSFQADTEKNLRKEILKHLKWCTSERDSSEESKDFLLKYLQELLEVKKDDPGTGETVDENSEAEAILRKLEDSLVFTFGLRSLGPLQWSKSKRIIKSERENNYRSAREKSEIIHYFLSNENLKKYDSEKEGEIFRMLTDHANYSFELENDAVAVKLDGKFVEVLKLSEGILEAKYLSLLLASTEFFTVLLEEPDRGMHPQMIQMIRDIVLPQVKGKTIIIVSHNPILIASWSIPRTYKFYKERCGDEWISNMVPVGSIAQNGKNKIPRLLASEDYVSMIFASKVIFVEGQSDFYFVKAILAHMLNPSNDKTTKRVINLALSEEKTNNQQLSSSDTVTETKSSEFSDDTFLSQFRTFLASLHVVKLCGQKCKQKWQYVSRELGISGLFLLDRNAVVKVKIVDTCNWAAEIAKREIGELVIEALNSKQGKCEVKSLSIQQNPKSQYTQENPDLKTETLTSDFQQPLTGAKEHEQGNKKKHKHQDKQGNPELEKLKTAVTKAMTYKFWNQTDSVNEGTKDEHTEHKPLTTAKETMKEMIKKIVSCIDSGNKVENTLNYVLNEDDKRNYLQYFHSVYEDLLLKNTSDKIPISTILCKSNLEIGVVSEDCKSRFDCFVEKNNWSDARKCLEEEGVFVWKSGNLEDAFIDLVIKFDECADDTRHKQMLKRHMLFARLGIDLNLTKLSTRKQTKLFMNDKVSDENINESIVSAFNLCSKESDITQFIRFLLDVCTVGLKRNIQR